MSLLRFLQRLTAQWNAIARTPPKQVLGISSNFASRDQPFYHHDPLSTKEKAYRYATGVTRWTVLETIDEMLMDTEEQFMLIYHTLFDIRFSEMMRTQPPPPQQPLISSPPEISADISLKSFFTQWSSRSSNTTTSFSPSSAPIPISSALSDVKQQQRYVVTSSSSPSSSPSVSSPLEMTQFTTNLTKNEHKQEIQSRISALKTLTQSLQASITGLKITQGASGYTPEENATYKERCDALILKIERVHKDKFSVYLTTLDNIYGHLKNG